MDRLRNGDPHREVMAHAYCGGLGGCAEHRARLPVSALRWRHCTQLPVYPTWPAGTCTRTLSYRLSTPSSPPGTHDHFCTLPAAAPAARTRHAGTCSPSSGDRGAAGKRVLRQCHAGAPAAGAPRARFAGLGTARVRREDAGPHHSQPRHLGADAEPAALPHRERVEREVATRTGHVDRAARIAYHRADVEERERQRRGCIADPGAVFPRPRAALDPEQRRTHRTWRRGRDGGLHPSAREWQRGVLPLPDRRFAAHHAANRRWHHAA